jgi:5-methylcytosine-specific restriction protein A
MSINAALNLFLEEYPRALEQSFSGHAVADFVRNEVPDVIRKAIGDPDRYLVHGSAGKGNWARVPWVAVFDRLVTETAQDGLYIVYLVKEDFSGVYLSLNQGVTTVRNVYGADAKSALAARAADYLARLGKLPGSVLTGPIDLSVADKTGLGAFYEAGAICSRLYARNQIPGDKALEEDLRQFMEMSFF